MSELAKKKKEKKTERKQNAILHARGHDFVNSVLKSLVLTSDLQTSITPIMFRIMFPLTWCVIDLARYKNYVFNKSIILRAGQHSISGIS